MFKSELGDILYWGPMEWFVITEVDYHDYMSGINETLDCITLKKSQEKNVAMTLGGAYMTSIQKSEDAPELLYRPAEEFFTEDVLNFIELQFNQVKLDIKAARKLRI